MDNKVESTDNVVSNVDAPKKKHHHDPQIVVTGLLKEGQNSDIITFKFSLALFEIVCIVTIPSEGTKTSPVYVKFRVRNER